MESLSLEQIEKRLLAYIAGDRVHPALILAGPGAAAKNRIAKRMAQVLLCPKRKSLPPFCGKCSTCRRIEQDGHPDVIWIREPEEDSIKIDRIRELCHQMELTPVEGDCKIAIIEGAQRMNTASSNAFLKTLEEPGVGRHFWLLAEQHAALLPTVLSRCLLFHFPPESVATEDLGEWDRFLTELAQTGDYTPLTQHLKDKEKCLELVRYLQMQWRLAALSPTIGKDPATVFQSASFWDALVRFDEAVQLEGRLRSNANPGLLVESHLRETLPR